MSHTTTEEKCGLVNFPICHLWQATRDSYGNFFRHSMWKNPYHISPQWWYETNSQFQKYGETETSLNLLMRGGWFGAKFFWRCC